MISLSPIRDPVSPNDSPDPAWTYRVQYISTAPATMGPLLSWLTGSRTLAFHLCTHNDRRCSPIHYCFLLLGVSS